MQSKKNLLQTGIIVGVCLGAVTGFLLPLNALQYWKQLSCFPYPVSRIVYVDVWGDTIWVEADNGDLYIVRYPYEDQCWEKSMTPPDSSDRAGFGPYFDLKIRVCMQNMK